MDEKLAQKAVIYGLTTGFGKFSDTFVPEQETAALQRNLIISHACGMGAPLPREVVRGAMLLRCNALARGNSGIRLSTLETLLAMLNRGVHPVIPEKGSLGASGDLAPLAHIVLVMLGEGEAEYQNAVLPGKRAMELAGLAPVELAAKEGLALINGTQIMTAIACGVVYDAVQLAKTADIAAAMTCEAQLGILSAFDPEVHALRSQQGADAHGAESAAASGREPSGLRAQPGEGAGRLFDPLRPADPRRQPRRHPLCVGYRQPRDQCRDRQPAHLPPRRTR